jgi:hypothetical protein
VPLVSTVNFSLPKLIPSLAEGDDESKYVLTDPLLPDEFPPIRKLQVNETPQLEPNAIMALPEDSVVSFRSNSPPPRASIAELPCNSNGLVIVALPDTSLIIASPGEE